LACKYDASPKPAFVTETDRRLVFFDQVAENSGEDGTATANTTSTSAPANYVEAQLIFLLGSQARRVLIA
jgi:hypothetical protein